jgi:hypothetical protein
MQNGSLSQRVIALHHCLHSEAEWCDYQLESPTPESPILISLIIPYQNWGFRRWGFRRYMIPNQLSPQYMTCKGSNATGLLLICIMSLLNNPNINYAFLDGIFKIASKFISQVWIPRGFMGDSCVPLTYAYILLESKHAGFYELGLSTIKAAAPLFNPPNFRVDFETSEHSEIRSHYPNSTIHVCLFHLKQTVTRHFKDALPAYGANALLRSDFCSFFGLAFVPVADTETCWRLLKNYLLNEVEDPRTNYVSEGGNDAVNLST